MAESRPVYVTLADEIAAGIRGGTYRSGERLPSVRALARARAVSVASALAAYRYLEERGLAEARPRSGYYVHAARAPEAEAPRSPARRAQPRPVTGQELALSLVKAASNPAVVQLGAAVPDPSFLPTHAVGQVMAQVVRSQRSRIAGYEMSPGAPELRRQIARRMIEAGCMLSPDELVVTSGCQEALTLALRAVTEPGDIVALESPTFYGLLQVVDALGLQALEIPSSADTGMSLEALELALDRWPVKACVTVPNHSNPLGFRMPDDAKRRMLRLLARYRVPVIEDDVYGDLGFDSPRPLMLMAAGEGAEILHCSSVSKTLSPGLRVGWIAPGRHQARVEYLKYVSDIATGTADQITVAEFLASGRYDRHMRTVRRQYGDAVARMREDVVRLFPAGTRISRPTGGFVLWIELPEAIDTVDIAYRALEADISIAPGPLFSASGKYRNCMRLSCARPRDARLQDALVRLGAMVAG